MTALTLDKVSRISAGQAHCAFTDLISCPFNAAHLLVSYRQAEDHMSHDGHIEVALLSDDGQVYQRQRLLMSGWDLRDPKFCLDEKGVLWLTAYAKYFDSDGKMQQTRNVSWFTTTGTSWSSMHWFGENRWWLWRPTWHQKQAYSLAYKRPTRRLDLFTGHPGKAMHRAVTGVFQEEKTGPSFANESTLFFDEADALWALTRRDGGDMTARLGTAKPPYTRWQWQSLPCYIGGPAWLSLTDQTMLVAGRDFDGRRLTTKLWLLHRPTGTLKTLQTLPSGGDTSYPGLVMAADTLYVSYYSSHIDASSRVYLAELSGVNALRDIVEQREVSHTRK